MVFPSLIFRMKMGRIFPNENKIKNIRLVFMDIELETGVHHSSKSVVAIPLSRLDTVIMEDNGPYILFIREYKV